MLKRSPRAILRSILLVPAVQIALVRARILYFVNIRRQLRTLDSDFAFKTTIMNNMKGLRHYNGRTDILIRPLSIIESLPTDAALLIIGPRNEHDLFSAIGHGFAPGRVRGLDLISYSPMIDLGDMHATPYPDAAFDAVVVGWTLSYSRDPHQFAREILRIVKPGGLVAIGVEYSTLTEEDSVALSGYAIQESEYLAKRINSTQEIRDIFGDSVDHVFFDHDAPRRRSHTRDGMIEDVSAVATIFSVKPAGP